VDRPCLCMALDIISTAYSMHFGHCSLAGAPHLLLMREVRMDGRVPITSIKNGSLKRTVRCSTYRTQGKVLMDAPKTEESSAMIVLPIGCQIKITRETLTVYLQITRI